MSENRTDHLIDQDKRTMYLAGFIEGYLEMLGDAAGVTDGSLDLLDTAATKLFARCTDMMRERGL